jgi:PAS domain S-box-containing protein/putative nucleotidyltransferase with HDIG domain
MARVLIVDDEENIRLALGETLANDGHQVHVAADATTAFQLLGEHEIDVVIADIVMPNISGIDLLGSIHDVALATAVIIITGDPSVDTAAEAVRLGALDYLVKPLRGEQIRRAVRTAAQVVELKAEQARLENENNRYRRSLEELVSQRTKELETKETHLRLITGNMSDMVCTTDMQGRVQYASQSHLHVLGFEPRQMIDTPILHYVAPDDRNAFTAIINECGLNRMSGKVEFRFRCADGHTIWLETIGKPLLDEAGKPSGLIFCSRDIGERKLAEEELRHSFERLGKTLWGTIEAMASLVETRDPYTAGHQRRVTDLAVALAGETGFSGVGVEALRMAGIVHDIGKIAVPSEILNKPGELTATEFELIKSHSEVGFNILKNIDFSLPVAEIVREHHERVNGAGYPRGLKGDDILPEARILAVADVVEAMASHRPYRPSLGIDSALKEITQYAGVLYDAQVVKHCLNLFSVKKYALPKLPAETAHSHRRL